ncbi:hypothetical protein DER45DRAFT_580918 [Fusarium avenaceum]|nr:hypothetical protein DER45DRAFT_580918 [Fusarium avenaceum]
MVYYAATESDANCGYVKWDQDEEGTAALIMTIRLRKIEFELQFERSERYLEGASGEDDEQEKERRDLLRMDTNLLWIHV